MDDIFQAMDELREATIEDLATAGQILLGIRERVKMDDFQAVGKLMPSWKWDRFIDNLSEAATAVLKAMDSLSKRKESPTTEMLVADVLERWRAMPAREKEAMVDQFRKAFTPPAANGQHPKPTGVAT